MPPHPSPGTLVLDHIVNMYLVRPLSLILRLIIQSITVIHFAKYTANKINRSHGYGIQLIYKMIKLIYN